MAQLLAHHKGLLDVWTLWFVDESQAMHYDCHQGKGEHNAHNQHDNNSPRPHTRLAARQLQLGSTVLRWCAGGIDVHNHVAAVESNERISHSALCTQLSFYLQVLTMSRHLCVRQVPQQLTISGTDHGQIVLTACAHKQILFAIALGQIVLNLTDAIYTEVMAHVNLTASTLEAGQTFAVLRPVSSAHICASIEAMISLQLLHTLHNGIRRCRREHYIVQHSLLDLLDNANALGILRHLLIESCTCHNSVHFLLPNENPAAW